MSGNSGYTKINVLLVSLTGILLGLSYPPMPTGVLAAFAFIPFFAAFESVERYGQAFRYSYIAFFVLNLITLYWTGGFTHAKDWYLMAAGGMLLLVHPMFFSIPILAWMFFRKQFGFNRALVAFPFIWLAFEYAHSATQIAFPWLLLGNTQTYDLAAIQFASVTGVYGISFWLLVLNIIGFTFYKKVSTAQWGLFSIPAVAVVLALAVLYLAPKIYGDRLLSTDGAGAQAKPLRIGIIQPDIDPFVKWEEEPEAQIGILERLTREVAHQHVDLVLWPETAIPFYILQPHNAMVFARVKQMVDSLGVNLLTGVPDIVYYREGEAAPKSSKVAKSGERYDTFNSSMLLKPNSDEIQKYPKHFLVPFAERVPFSEELSFLNAMQWNFGLGGWEIGKDTTVFRIGTQRNDSAQFSNLICYESIYPGYVASFVRKGAGFLTLITNDSWWGNTSGAYQHKQYGVLRAVENRRWVAQCANGGISCIIDPFGRILQSTALFTRGFTVAELQSNSEMTFYTLHGDWFAEMCMVLGFFCLMAALGSKMYTNIRSGDNHEHH